MSQVHHIASATEFQALLSTTNYVIADFYADWCGPCRVIAPNFTQLASSHGITSKVAFAKVNVDTLQDVARTYGVTAMPTFIVFHNGRVTSSIRGANAPALKTAVQDVGRLAKLEGETTETAAPPRNESIGKEKISNETVDAKPVSGNYSMTSGARSDWKMSLRG
jgi:thioredoxin 1